MIKDRRIEYLLQVRFDNGIHECYNEFTRIMLHPKVPATGGERYV